MKHIRLGVWSHATVRGALKKPGLVYGRPSHQVALGSSRPRVSAALRPRDRRTRIAFTGFSMWVYASLPHLPLPQSQRTDIYQHGNLDPAAPLFHACFFSQPQVIYLPRGAAIIDRPLYSYPFP